MENNDEKKYTQDSISIIELMKEDLIIKIDEKTMKIKYVSSVLNLCLLGFILSIHRKNLIFLEPTS